MNNPLISRSRSKLKSNALCPVRTDFASQHMVFNHMASHYRRIYTAKNVVDSGKRMRQPCNNASWRTYCCSQRICCDSETTCSDNSRSGSYCREHIMACAGGRTAENSTRDQSSRTASSRHHYHKSPVSKQRSNSDKHHNQPQRKNSAKPETNLGPNFRHKSPVDIKMVNPRHYRCFGANYDPKLSSGRADGEDLINKHSEKFQTITKPFQPKILKTAAKPKLQKSKVYHPPRRKKKDNHALLDNNEKENWQESAEASTDRDSAYNGGTSSGGETRGPTPEQNSKELNRKTEKGKLCSARADEYTLFCRDLVKEILKKKVFTPSGLQVLINQHINNNKDKLDINKMHSQIKKILKLMKISNKDVFTVNNESNLKLSNSKNSSDVSNEKPSECSYTLENVCSVVPELENKDKKKDCHFYEKAICDCKPDTVRLSCPKSLIYFDEDEEEFNYPNIWGIKHPHSSINQEEVKSIVDKYIPGLTDTDWNLWKSEHECQTDSEVPEFLIDQKYFINIEPKCKCDSSEVLSRDFTALNNSSNMILKQFSKCQANLCKNIGIQTNNILMKPQSKTEKKVGKNLRNSSKSKKSTVEISEYCQCNTSELEKNLSSRNVCFSNTEAGSKKLCKVMVHEEPTVVELIKALTSDADENSSRIDNVEFLLYSDSKHSDDKHQISSSILEEAVNLIPAGNASVIDSSEDEVSETSSHEKTVENSILMNKKIQMESDSHYQTNSGKTSNAYKCTCCKAHLKQCSSCSCQIIYKNKDFKHSRCKCLNYHYRVKCPNCHKKVLLSDNIVQESVTSDNL